MEVQTPVNLLSPSHEWWSVWCRSPTTSIWGKLWGRSFEGQSKYASNVVLSSAWALPGPFWSKSNMSYCFSLAYLSTLYCDKFQALTSPPFNRDHSLFHTYMYNWGMSTPAYDPSPSFLELFIVGPIGSVLFQKDCDTNDNRAFSSRVVTKISSCQVNTTSRWGIKWLGISFGSIFLLFSNKSSRGKSPAPGS